MDDRQKILKTFSTKSDIGGTISINDLREKEYSGEKLTSEEKLALQNFDKYRIKELNKLQQHHLFHEKYRQLQVVANLGDYKEFLKDEYSH